MQKKIFIIEKIQNTESAQLCWLPSAFGIHHQFISRLYNKQTHLNTCFKYLV